MSPFIVQKIGTVTLPYMVRPVSQEVLPISGFPETKTFHVGVVIPHWSVAIRCSVKVKVDELLEVRPDYLVSIDKNDLLQIHWEQNIQEQDLVSPDDPLFFSLFPKPRWPFISNEFVLKVVRLSEMWDEFLTIMYKEHIVGGRLITHKERRRQKVFDKPKLHSTLGISKYAQDHD
jgi:hypothetical protein